MVRAGPHQTCHTSDRLGRVVKTAPRIAEHGPAHAPAPGPRFCQPSISSPFFRLLRRSLPRRPLHAFSPECRISISPLTHGGDPRQRLAMMMSPAALEGLPRESSFVWKQLPCCRLMLSVHTHTHTHTHTHSHTVHKKKRHKLPSKQKTYHCNSDI